LRPGKLPPIPLLVLLAIAIGSGLLAAAAARRYPRHRTPVVAAARRAGRRQSGLRAAWLSRLDPEVATGLALTVALALIFAAGILIAVLAFLVRDSDVLSGLDSGAADFGAEHATALSTHGLKVVTAFGETWMAAAVCVVVALVDWRRTGSRWAALFLLAVIVGDKLLTTGLKELVDRVRPDLNPIAHTLGPSFPSGHSSTAAALWAAAALVAGRWVGRRAIAPLAGLAVGIAVGVAASRVLLDVHWLTDVIAGLALGWAWFATCAIAFGGRIMAFGAPVEAAQDAAESRPPARGSRVAAGQR
jgi:membrane-associated phospholipid phosphatase